MQLVTGMKMEVLAPVGSMEALIAAVRAGADAVYFGAEEFNARRNAHNFDNDSLKSAINYCRLNEVKCYLTLNTLVKDNEFDSAISLALRAWEYGIDAIIIQDIGLAATLHSLAPEIVLHASTQMSVHSAAALPFLKNLGFKRVVPAREMSEEELRLLCNKAKTLDIEVEVFVHGALCMCISGQCYFSAYLGGRSANRGLCAGTCRLPFKVKGGTGFDLSLKDLSLIKHLKILNNIGVTSLKIEGRMKRPEYVAATVDAVKKCLENGNLDEDTIKLLENVFSRNGFTDGYFKGYLGKNMFGVRNDEDKITSKSVLSSIHELYRRERQRLPLNFKFKLKSNQPATLTASYKNISATVTGDVPEVAINKPLDKNKVLELLNKLGGSCYFLDNAEIEIENGITLSAASINTLKKTVVEKINSLRSFERNIADIKPKSLDSGGQKSLNNFFARFSTLEQLLESKGHLSSLSGYSLPAKVLITAIDKNKSDIELLTNAVAELPRASFNDEQLEALLCSLKTKGIKTIICSNLAEIVLADKMSFEIIGGFGLNVFNSYSVDYLSNIGIKNIIISPELSSNEINSLCINPEIKALGLCYGRQPLMLTRNCPVKNGIGCKGRKDFCEITDRLGNTFPVICDNGISEILNTKITDVSDLIGGLSLDVGYLYFTLETPQEAKKIICDFLSQEVHYGSDFTRGLYKNGVK